MSLSLQSFGIIGSVVLLAGFLLYRAALPKPIPGIPYNKEATKNLFGDVPTFMKYHAETSELYSWLVKQCAKLDSPIIQVFMRPFGKPWVLITDFQESQDIMARRTKEFGRSEFFGDLFSAVLPKNHVHMPLGDEWHAHRRLIGDAMSPDFLNKVAGPQIYNTALDTIQLWKEKARLANGRPFNAAEDVNHSALDVIWAAAFGSQIGTTKSQIDALTPLKSIQLPVDVDTAATIPVAPTPAAFNSIITLTQSVEIATTSPFPRPHHWFALNFYPKLRAAGQHKDKLITERLNEAWNKFSQDDQNEDKIYSALDLFVQREVSMAKKEGRTPQYDTPAMRDELLGFLFAGHDTTSTTVCWGLKYLTANQEVQKKLRTALRTQFKRAYDADEMPTVQEIVHSETPYLDATIEEFHRLGGTAPAIMRVALQDTQILGHHIPKGTDVFMITQGPGYIAPPVKVDPSKRTASSLDTKDRYGSWDPATIQKFMPERWLSENEKGHTSFNPWAGPVHPFGAGTRGCWGRKLASQELKILVTLIIWNFELQPTPAELSTFAAHDVLTHGPQKCYLRLAEAK